MSRFILALLLVGVSLAIKCEDGLCNVAYGGIAKQSSTGWGGWAARAIDGKTSGQWGDRSCTHTRYQKGNKWEAKLNGYLFDNSYKVQKVVIYNRQDCCSTRIYGTKVYVKNGASTMQLCGTITAVLGKGPRFEVDCGGKNATDVIITQDKSYLTLCEVQVFANEADLPKVEYVNLALNGTASQTSIGWGGAANRAIDGNSNSQWSGQSCTHTQKQNVNKWSVTLPNALFGAKYPIYKVVIYNRMDCCSDRINNAKVWVGKEMCGQVKYEAGVRVYAVDCEGKEGATVSVSLDNNYLTLCEVEVYVHESKTNPEVGSYVNVAKNGTATQSSMGWGGVAARGNDGNTNSKYSARSCTHSRYGANNKWMLSLAGSAVGVTYPISKIIIYNRLDCCSNRIDNVKIWVDKEMIGQVKYDGSGTYGFDLNGTKGGVITIQNDKNYLTLCEVEVYVKEGDVPKLPDIVNVAREGTPKQSSEGWGGKAERAIDGNTAGQWGSRSCTHSRYSKNNWWKVTLKEDVEVSAVKIFNRVDCCQNRINGAEVYVDRTKCGTVTYNGASSYVIPCEPGTNGREVTIIQKSNYLTLCEVEVLVVEEEGTEEVDEEI